MAISDQLEDDLDTLENKIQNNWRGVKRSILTFVSVDQKAQSKMRDKDKRFKLQVQRASSKEELVEALEDYTGSELEV